MVQYQYEPKHSEANHSLEEKKEPIYMKKSQPLKKAAGCWKYPAVLLHYLTRKYGLYFFLMLLALSKALKLVHTESLKQCQTN